MRNLSNKFLLLLAGITFAIVIFGLLLYRTPTTPSENTIYTPLLSFPLQKTTDETLSALDSYNKKTKQADGTTVYSYSTPNLSRDTQIITDANNTVIFKKVITTDTDLTHPKISEYRNRYGDPEAVITGSHTYGPYATFTLYPAKGIVIVGNPLTDEVFEIHQFPAMSIEEYKEKYGKDINENASPIHAEDK